MRLSLRESALAAVCYADVFDYPLTEEEVSLWCIGRTISPSRVKKLIGELSEGRSGPGTAQAVFLKGRRGIVGKRAVRSAAARKKFLLAGKKAWVYSFIPSVLLVGVTGGVASANAGPDDDIDLFFVVKDGTLWTSRFFITAATELFSRRRRPETKELTDAMCLNMFLTDASLEIPSGERDLYAAHEILSMMPLWEREGIYRRFLSENSWVRTFLPSAWNERMNDIDGEVQGWESYPYRSGPFSRWYVRAADMLFRGLEPVLRAFQKFYMRKRITREVISEHALMFHPYDMRGFIRAGLQKRLSPFNIPLDKVFYGRLK